MRLQLKGPAREKIINKIEDRERGHNHDRNKGYFGQFGGSFVPEPIQNLLNQLEETFEQYKNDPEFIAEYKHYLKDYSGRKHRSTLRKV